MKSPFAPLGPRQSASSGSVDADLHARKRYAYFRPWFEGARVVDVGCGCGFGTDLATIYAAQALGLDVDGSTVTEARQAFPHARFRGADASAHDYTTVDVVLAFDLLPFVRDPGRVMRALAGCAGALAISVPNPAHLSADAGRLHHWTLREYQKLIADAFPGRRLAWLSQDATYPGDFHAGLSDDALYWFALAGDREVPAWPSVGNSMPCYNNAAMAAQAVRVNLGAYPGRMGYGLVANGCTDEETAILEDIATEFPDHVRLGSEPENIGGGPGWNQALCLVLEQGFDLYAGGGDDVFPSPNCMAEMVWVYGALREEGLMPGWVAPMSNSVSGRQQVDIGAIQGYDDVVRLASGHERRYARTATPMLRLIPLMFVMGPEVIETLGAFDPRFGFGTCGDDDFNVRLMLAGFGSFTADGAFAYHVGSVAFRKAGLDFLSDQARGVRTLLAKYRCARYEDVYTLTETPLGVSLYIPVGARRTPENAFEVPMDGRRVDLVLEATDEEFAAWVAIEMARRPREERWRVLRAIRDAA